MDKSDISNLCVESLAAILRVPKGRIDPHTKFSRLGLDSAMSVYLLMELEERLGVELSPEAIYDHPTVDALSEYIVRKRAESPSPARP